MKKAIQTAMLVAAIICLVGCNEKKDPAETKEVVETVADNPAEGTLSERDTQNDSTEELDQPVLKDTEEAEEAEEAEEEEEEEEADDAEETAEQEPAPKKDGKTLYVYSDASDGFTNIRQEPSSKSKIVGGLVNNGPGAKLLERGTNGWYKVDFNGIVGYVSGSIVAIGDEDGPLNQRNKDKNSSKPKTSGNTQQKVYYVVMGSWPTMEKAKKYYEYVPDALDMGRIYKTSVNGKPVYRMAIECYKNKQQAQKMVRNIKETFDRDVWIWESQGLGQCVYCPKGYDGNPTKPLQPI